MRHKDTLFTGMSELDRNNVLALCSTRSVAPRTVIVSQGSAGRDMYIVVSGSLKVSVLSDEGKEISFVVLREGDYFGELSLIDGRRRSATVSAINKTELLVLSHSEYQQLLTKHPLTATVFLTRMLLTMADRLRATDELYQDSVFLDVSARLAKFLLKVSKREDGEVSVQRTLEVQLSQYELGTLVNASRESVNKQLRDWEAQEIVSVNRGKIALLNPEYLKKKATGLL